MTNSAVQMNDIRDIKPPIEISEGNQWIWRVLIFVALVVAAILIWRWLKNKKTNIVLPPPIPAHLRAKRNLADALAFITEPKRFCTLVSDTARFYLEERFQFRAPERTTEEFLRELAGTKLLLPEQKESLGEFLASCDLVKFAKYEPGENELHALYESAVNLVDETASMEILPPLAATVLRSESQKGNVAAANPAKGRLFAIVGALLQLWPAIWLWLFFKTLFGLVAAAQQQPGGFKPDDLQAMAQTLHQKFGGLGNWLPWFASLIGLYLIMEALTSLRYRARWFFWFVIVFGVLILWAFPIGTLAGIFYIGYAWKRRREFTG